MQIILEFNRSAERGQVTDPGTAAVSQLPLEKHHTSMTSKPTRADTINQITDIMMAEKDHFYIIIDW